MDLFAEGENGQMAVDDKFVTITRKGYRAAMSHGSKGERRIPISSIMTVQFRAATGSAAMSGSKGAGYIQFGVLGGGGSLRAAVASRAWPLVKSDENSVSFRRKQQPLFEGIRNYIESRISERDAGQPSAQPAAPSIARELAELAKLRDSGILTDAEFESQKVKLLRD